MRYNFENTRGITGLVEANSNGGVIEISIWIANDGRSDFGHSKIPVTSISNSNVLESVAKTAVGRLLECGGKPASLKSFSALA